MAADYSQLVIDLYNANTAPVNDSLIRAIAYANAIKAFYESGSLQIGSLSSNGSNSAGPVSSTNTNGGTFV
jgi:hypothetical protein